MKEKLRPTVWRTARALDNENRLRFLRAIFVSKEAKGVTRLAEDIGVSVSTASQYLRALNARGLVDVKRESSYVYYGSGKNRSLPEAQLLQDAFRRLFERKNLPSDWPARISPVLKAYANERRISIIRTIADNGSLTFASLSRLADMPETSLLRHLSLLLDGGVVAQDERRQYVIRPPQNSLQQALLKIATSES